MNYGKIFGVIALLLWVSVAGMISVNILSHTFVVRLFSFSGGWYTVHDGIYTEIPHQEYRAIDIFPHDQITFITWITFVPAIIFSIVASFLLKKHSSNPDIEYWKSKSQFLTKGDEKT